MCITTYRSHCIYNRGVKLNFISGHISIMVALKGPVVTLKVPCHAFPVITRPLVCYEASACKRSAESQTLKVHPVANKTLTQRRPVSAAPERLVGHFSFSIVCFLGSVTCEHPDQQQMDQSVEHLTHQDPLAN